MTDAELSRLEGKSPNYYYELKSRNYEKYRLIRELGSMAAYKEHYNTLQVRLGEIYYEIKAHPILSFTSFYEYNFKDAYATPQSFAVMVSKIAFNSQEKAPSLAVYRKAEEMVNSYYDWIDHIKESLPKRPK